MALVVCALASGATALRAVVSAGAADPAPAVAVAPCPATFHDLGTGAAPRTCDCTPAATRTGDVWGVDYYTVESSICRSALHAGQVSSGGGEVTIFSVQGLGAY